MNRPALTLLLAAACTAPDYDFASSNADAGNPDIQVKDSGPLPVGNDDDASVDSGLPTDASIPTDAAVFTLTAMPSTGDFGADCTAYVQSITGKGASGTLITNGASKPRCIMFFFNSSWGRNWSEANAI